MKRLLTVLIALLSLAPALAPSAKGGVAKVGARSLTPYGQWSVTDRLAEKFYPVSPYSYCAGDPINYVDPDGQSTIVVPDGNGKFRINGGNIEDNDYGIYIHYPDGTEVLLGVTPTLTSFYNSDEGDWVTSAIIDPNDESGLKFIYNMTGENTPGLVNYMLNAGNNKKYDFKATNGEDNSITGINYYRGMPIGKNESGQTIYTSARDIGNMVAGYVAAKNGLNWDLTRLGFDGYQSITSKKITTEGISSQNAQRYGWELGNKDCYKR